MSRAKGIAGCPTGKIMNRKSTSESTAEAKYAKDCYSIQMFILCDDSQIEEVIRRDKLPQKPTCSSNHSKDDINIEQKVLIQSLLERVTKLENSLENHVKQIKSLQDTNNELNDKIIQLTTNHEHLSSDVTRKSIQTDSSIRLLKQHVKQLDDYDLNNFHENIHKVACEVERMNKVQTNAMKSLNELKLAVKPSYACVTDPQGTPEKSKHQHLTENLTRDNTQTNTQSQINEHTTNCNDNRQGELTEPIHSKHSSNTVNSERENDLQPTERNIPRRIHGVTETLDTPYENTFIGVTRNRTARYYLSGIDYRSTRSGILHFLETKGVTVTYLQIFKSKGNTQFITAKINVKSSDAEFVVNKNFWPKGVKCRQWYSQREWFNRCNNDDEAENHPNTNYGYQD